MVPKQAEQPDPRIEALRMQLGESRFFRFIANLPASGRIHFWQSRELDVLEQREGVVLPREASQLTPLLAPLLPAHPTMPPEDVPSWVIFDELGGSAPVQATGRTTDPPASFYFRARHEHWSIGLSCDPEVDPVDVGGTEDGLFFHEENFGYDRDEASYMPLDVARFFIVRELRRWQLTVR